MTEPVTRSQVGAVLAALGEEFVLDIEAVHAPDGSYFIEYTTLCQALCNANPEWVEQITDYVNGASDWDKG